MASAQFRLFPEEAGAPTLREVAEAIRAAGIDGLPDAQRRADQARYQEVHVKSALTRCQGMPFKWALNPYRGCTHACEYCYARKYQRHLELGAGDDFSTMIFAKPNLPEVLQKELTRRTWARETVAVGTATDPYQPIEGHYRITRRCLEVLAASRTSFSIVTKGPMVVRDVDILREATRAAGCRVAMSIASVDPEAWARLEPGTAAPAQRLRAVRQLLDAGIDAGVLMMPLVPGITTSPSHVERTLRAIGEAGASFIGANVTHLDEGVREHFLGFLTREYPSLVDGYVRLYPGKYAAPDYVRRITRLVNETAARLGVRKSGRQDP